MVISAITILSVLVTEFTYTAQVNRRLAFDGLDRLRAHYLAKSGFKLSLLRLKAYQSVKSTLASVGGGAAAGAVPKSLLDKIWSFPFIYPIPTNIPGMSMIDKDALTKFQKESGFEGNYTALIESESSRYNMNMILQAFAPSPSPSGSPSPTPAGASPTPSPQPSVGPSTTPFNPEVARQGLHTFLDEILQAKFKADPDFADEYRNFRIDDLVDGIAAWADRTYEQKTPTGRESVPPKKAPFYSLNELHMVQGMDDPLFDLFSPNMTVATTPGINVNTIQEAAFRALVPRVTDDEVKEFFKFRDSQTQDNLFKKPEDFFKYLQANIAGFRNDAAEITRFETDLKARNIQIVTDETNFKITVTAKVGQATRVIEAWVTLSSPKTTGTNPAQPNQPGGPTTPVAPPAGAVTTNQNAPLIDTRTGLRVTFMRIL